MQRSSHRRISVPRSITRTANGFDAAGKLTLRGVTRDQHVGFTIRTAQEQGQAVAYLTGKTLIKRLDFGVGQGDWKSTEWVGNDVTVSYRCGCSLALRGS